MPRINPVAVKAYDPKAWTLIPLHRYGDTSTVKRKGKKITRKDGKRPLDFSWTRATYNTRKVVERCIAENRNAGVRLTADQLVIDVDPRNGGDDGFSNLCLDLGIDEAAFPLVVTGSGGQHYYMSKPADVLIVDTLEAYPGVEFKSSGRQVVAAGSIHPDTLKHYAWDELSPALDALPPVPRKLLNIIKRPERPSAVTGGGQYTQEQLARALAKLDPTEFRDHDKWLRIMMACHHSTNGDGRHEFVEWSCSDPNYADDSEVIGRRWDSLHADKMDGITYRTLNYILAEHGEASAQAAPSDAADDFADDLEAESEEPSENAWLEGDGVAHENSGGYTDDSVHELEKLNSKYFVAVEGSKLKVFFKQDDPLLKRHTWARMGRKDFEDKYCNKRLMRDKQAAGLSRSAADTIPLGQAWFEWALRRTFESVMFDPSGKPSPGHFNLWDGFALEPHRQGEWSLLRELIHDVLASGDDEVDRYILNWLAFLVQKPHERAEVALVFRGAMGVGKGTLGNVIAHVIGRHALAIASPELITGRFNSHLQDVIFLFADEAIKPYDKQAESRLKAFITEPVLAFEGKGRDAVVGPNFLHIMMASNDSWVIPAGIDERRFLVSDANTKWQGQETKWKSLWAQLHEGNGLGFRRLMFDLQRRDIEKFHPRKFPVTEALIDQKIKSMSPLRQFLFEGLTEGVLPCLARRGPWDQGAVRVFVEDFRAVFSLWCRERGINPSGMGRGQTRFLFQELRQVFRNVVTDIREPVESRDDISGVQSDGRAQAFELPALKECREDFERQLGGKLAWSGDSDFG